MYPKLLVVLVFLCQLPTAFAEDHGCPLVHEEVDEVIIVYREKQTIARVYFIRDQQILADRLKTSEMHWGVRNDRFFLTWDDYCRGRVVRVIEFDYFSTVVIPADYPYASTSAQPWWGMGRNMRDLKQPVD